MIASAPGPVLFLVTSATVSAVAAGVTQAFFSVDVFSGLDTLFVSVTFFSLEAWKHAQRDPSTEARGEEARCDRAIERESEIVVARSIAEFVKHAFEQIEVQQLAARIAAAQSIERIPIVTGMRRDERRRLGHLRALRAPQPDAIGE